MSGGPADLTRLPSRALVLATRSEGKLRELLPLLEAHGWSACTLASLGLPETVTEDTLEQFATFEANAEAKARHFAALTGRPVLADDSGLAVDALDGAPGVHSKRWSGRTDVTGTALDAVNNAHLQAALAAAAARGRPERTARYVCAMALVVGSSCVVARGETRGALLREPRGSGGFGYDPLFLSDDLGVTFAEATRDAKASVSHRGRALRALLAVMPSLPPVDPEAEGG